MTTDEYEGSIPSLVTKQIKLIKMSKETQNINLAESKALNIPVFMWRFCAYKTEKDYESGEHYFVKDFLKHHKMKNYSAKHSKKEKPRHADYCSMYWKIEC